MVELIIIALFSVLEFALIIFCCFAKSENSLRTRIGITCIVLLFVCIGAMLWHVSKAQSGLCQCQYCNYVKEAN